MLWKILFKNTNLDFRAENNTGNRVFKKAGKNIFTHFYIAVQDFPHL